MTSLVQKGNVASSRITTKFNVIDPLTKAITQQKHVIHVRASEVKYASNWL